MNSSFHHLHHRSFCLLWGDVFVVARSAEIVIRYVTCACVGFGCFRGNVDGYWIYVRWGKRRDDSSMHQLLQVVTF